MRILFVLHQFYPEFAGGTERVTLNLARSAQRAGHHVQVLACNVNSNLELGRPSPALRGAREYVHHGVPVFLLPRSALPATGDFSFEVSSLAVTTLAAWMRQSQFDIAHVLHSMRMASAILAAQQVGLPYVITLTDFFTACFRFNLVNLQSKLCSGPEGGARCVRDCMTSPWTEKSFRVRYEQALSFLTAAGERVVPSEYVGKQLQSSFPGLDFRVVPHGIDLLAFKPDVKVPVTPGGGESAITFGYLGSIVKAKGLDTLLKAFRRVSGSGLRLRVVGGFYGDTGYHQEIRKLAEADERVELVGQVHPDAVPHELALFDVLCLPSRVPETFSLSVSEAAVAGVPALVSDLGAPAERVRKVGGGRVLPVDDVDAWASAMTDVVRSPTQLCAWQRMLPLPLRVEEEAFFYESLYRRLSLCSRP
ncbi:MULTISPECIES: glycosyltransferase [unclassified Diaphorobacter]|uniref:glycosyltransferase n=1 Tax=unclassified Diaphorobacter TaxID=2649760 RepID=UPI0022DD1651|nr:MULTISPECIES: glycosyltransferase [unclassified Diaphorobacter]